MGTFTKLSDRWSRKLSVAIAVLWSVSGCYIPVNDSYPAPVSNLVNDDDLIQIWINEDQGIKYEFNPDHSVTKSWINDNSIVMQVQNGSWRYCISDHPRYSWDCNQSYTQGKWIEVEGLDGLVVDLVFIEGGGSLEFYEYNPDHVPAPEDIFIQK